MTRDSDAPFSIQTISGEFKRLALASPVKFASADQGATLLIGPHQSGKSSILEALWLAWHGSDKKGACKSALALKNQLGQGGAPIAVDLTTNYGEIHVRVGQQMSRVVTGQLKQLDEVGELAACMPRLDTELEGKGALSDLVARFCPNVDSDDVPANLAERERTLWTEADREVTAENADMRTVEKLTEMAAWFAKEKNRLGRVRGDLTRKVDALRREAAISFSADERLEAEAAIAGWAARNDWMARVSRHEAWKRRASEVEALRETRASEAGRAATADKVLRIAEVVVPLLAEAVHDSRGDMCPCCYAPIQASRLYETWKQAQVDARAIVAALPKDLRIDPEPEAPGAEPPAPKLSLTAARDRLDQIARASGARAKVETLIEEAQRAEARQGFAKGLEEKSRRLLLDLAQTASSRAAETANRYLAGTRFRASVIAENGIAQWCLVDERGAVPELRYPSGLSGSEEAALRLAKALAESDGAPFRIIVLDDAELGAISMSSARREMVAALRAAKEAGLIEALIVASTDESLITQEDVVTRLGS